MEKDTGNKHSILVQVSMTLTLSFLLWVSIVTAAIL